MTKPITIRTVAEVAGVSKSTVSRVLNNQENVRPETRQKVMAAIEKLNYRPSSTARLLVTKKSRTIGVVVPDLADHLLALMVKGAEDFARKHDYNAVVYSTRWEVAEEWHYTRVVQEDQVDGILAVGGEMVPDAYLDFLVKQDIPIVLVDRIREHDSIMTVNANHERGAYQGVQYLLERGHRHLACITGPLNRRVIMDRQKGFERAVANYNVTDCIYNVLQGDGTISGGYEATRKLLKQSDPTAIFYTSDWMAIGGLRALQERGLHVPEDVSVMGCDDLEGTAYLNPPLTTLKQPHYEMGAVGMKLLIHRIEDREEPLPRNVDFDLELVVRESVRQL